MEETGTGPLVWGFPHDRYAAQEGACKAEAALGSPNVCLLLAEKAKLPVSRRQAGDGRGQSSSVASAELIYTAPCTFLQRNQALSDPKLQMLKENPVTCSHGYPSASATILVMYTANLPATLHSRKLAFPQLSTSEN